MSWDASIFRHCLGQFATGVTVVTCRTGDKELHGATVSSFTAVSLDPALVLVSLGRDSRMASELNENSFAVNVLSTAQQSIAQHFGRKSEGMAVEWDHEGEINGQPRIRGAAAYLSCAPWRTYDGGDHLLFLGQVQGFATGAVDPLVFHGGRFHRLDPENPTQPWHSSADAPGGTSSFHPASFARQERRFRHDALVPR